MTRCCNRRPEDGVVDRENIDRAVRGHNVRLSPTELKIAIGIMTRRGKGLNEIAGHFNYSRSQVAEIQKLQRGKGC